MLDSYVIIGLVMIIVGVLKTVPPFTSKRGKLLVPLLVFAVAGILNVANAYIFGGELLQALKDGLVLGAASGGIYSMGKATMQKIETTLDSIPHDIGIKADPMSAKTKEKNIS